MTDDEKRARIKPGARWQYRDDAPPILGRDVFTLGERDEYGAICMVHANGYDSKISEAFLLQHAEPQP